MSWLSDYFSREKLIAELRNENKQLREEMRDAEECLSAVNTNLLIVSKILDGTVEGDENGDIVRWIDSGEVGEDD